MDGTKPAMESNAEETQDEGQESKGTIIQPLTFAPFRVFFPSETFASAPDGARSPIIAMASRLCATQKGFLASALSAILGV